MTREELEKEAEEWAKNHHYYNGTVKGYVAERDNIINGYLAAAEPREKRIAELEAKIEQMKFNIKFDVESKLQDIVPYTVLKNILAKLEIKEK